MTREARTGLISGRTGVARSAALVEHCPMHLTHSVLLPQAAESIFEVDFELQCEFSPLLERTVGSRIVERLSREVIDAFVARAEQMAAS